MHLATSGWRANRLKDSVPAKAAPGKSSEGPGSPGNLCRAMVSNGIEDARTSHPCERGAGLL